MATSIKVPIFADTSLGTHIALDVNPKLKGSDFKRELEEAHLNCFPKLGKIRINALMVKRKSNFYHLPDSLHIKHVFQGFVGTWFIHIEACFLSENSKPKSNSIEVHKCHISRNEGAKGDFGEENKIGAISENHSEAISEAVSISGIIKKYFCDYRDDTLYSEVTSRANQNKFEEKLKNGSEDSFLKEKLSGKSQFMPKTPVRKLISPSKKGSRAKFLKNKFRKNEVGKRLIVASNEMGSNKSTRGFYFYKEKKSSPSTHSSLIKSLVFEIPDDDE